MESPKFLNNYHALVDHFGSWPSFHDANVISYSGPTNERQTVDLVLHTWEMTAEVDANGYFVNRKHALVNFHFAGVHSAALERFSSGNILFGLYITREPDADSFRVELHSVMDMSGSFAAKSGEVISVRPCTTDGKVN
jgi:hypothetical protein